MGSLSLSLQVVLISAGVLSLALLLKVSVPLVVDFSVYQAPLIWGSIASWLKPPYLYVILNCIIITIAASSRLHHNHGASDKEQQEQIPPAPKISIHEAPDQFHYQIKISAAEILSDYGGMESTVVVAEDVYEQRQEKSGAGPVFENKSTMEVEDDFAISKSTWIPPKGMDSSENLPELLLPSEKPLVSARFGHRKPVRASPEGGRRALRVAKPKRQETLENTWKTITEGRAMPLTRHLKQCETFENHGRRVNVCEADPSSPPKKSEKFKYRTNYQLPPVGNSPASGKLRKEPSVSQDELNRRVEAFIKKFNEEMRLQRQESLNQYKEMVTCGSH
ncbi:hypothetical protein P3X46_033325 [Hevea brasiliensis]|uniref:DUF4408 domain-containing protein n=1 Tax=Hevea brasiliensis TaxID=3981 RepID=A0ABQ9KG02_HEVBR|nr:uncharacterized protein LOC110670826 [Hevea brasiliensis]KAJ9136228.1 hypothetical protein P3X46_033325 [Hevea brasiliensis]